MHETKLLLLSILCITHPITCDITVNAVFLTDLSSFPISDYETILTTYFTTEVSILSTLSETITGAEARQLYFPGHTEIPLFKVVHIAHIVTSIHSDNNANTSAAIFNNLPALCQPKLGLMAIDSTSSDSAFDFIQQFPPLLGPVMIGVWTLTLASCGTCWLCAYCCCKKKQTKPPTTARPPPTVPIPTAPPPPIVPQTLTESYQPTAPIFQPTVQPTVQQKNPGIQALLRLPIELTEEQCADLYDPYVTQTHYGGPAAVRLASWPAD